MLSVRRRLDFEGMRETCLLRDFFRFFFFFFVVFFFLIFECVLALASSETSPRVAVSATTATASTPLRRGHQSEEGPRHARNLYQVGSPDGPGTS